MSEQEHLRQTAENTKNIGEVVKTVGILAETVKNSEEMRKEDRTSMKDVARELKELNQKILSVAGMQEKVAEQSESIRVISHDMRGHDQALQGIGILKDKLDGNAKNIIRNEERILAIEKRQDKQDGAAGAIKFLAHLGWLALGLSLATIYHIKNP